MVIESEIKPEKEVNLGGRPRLFNGVPVSRRQIRLPDEIWEKLNAKYSEVLGENYTPSDLMYAVANDVLT